MRLPLPEESLRRSFVVVCFGFAADRIRRQPWHVAHGLATGLTALGHHVRLVTDAGQPPSGLAYEIVRVPELIRDGRTSEALREAVAEVAPERVFMIIGALALARSRPLALGAPVWLVMASPRLTLRELMALGPRTLWHERALLQLPLANALLPGRLLRRGFARSGARDMVYLSEATRQRYEALGLPEGRHLVPQIDVEALIEPAPANGPPLVAYVGPPLDLRGARLALDAFEQAIAMGLDARLLMMLRPDPDARNLAAMLRRIEASPQRSRITVDTAMLDAPTLRQRLAPVRLFLLPFRLTVSEAPLITIEAGLSGRPVVTLEAPGVSEYVRALGGIVAPDALTLPAAIMEGLGRRPAIRRDHAAWTRWDQAVLPLLETRRQRLDHWRMVALVGVDGSGKTFLLSRLIARVEAARIAHRHVWSRFRNYLSKPLLALTRLTGHNRKEQVGPTRIGYHDFAGNRALAYGFLAFQVVDNVLDLLLRYRWKRGLILADRCIYDTLVDLAVDTGLDDLILDRLGPRLVGLLPRPHLAILLDRSPRLVLRDRPDALQDRHFARRRALYERLARRFELATVRNDGTPEETLAAIRRVIEAGGP